METEEERVLGLRQMPVDNFCIFFHIRDESVIITNVMYGASYIAKIGTDTY
jgi:toxin ParE1/3/4